MQRTSYPSDLNGQEWAILEPLIPPAKPGGHPHTTDMRKVTNAILYLDCTGCQWRALPHEFPPWSTVWSYFRQWRTTGSWKRMHTALRELPERFGPWSKVSSRYQRWCKEGLWAHILQVLLLDEAAFASSA